MPASARNSVDLPLPDGPFTSSVSPGETVRPPVASRAAPPGRLSCSSSIASAPPAFAVVAVLACEVVSAWKLSSKLVMRSVVARQAARLL
ncbi:hypothetical protein D9M69_617570 [compost metagenome]